MSGFTGPTGPTGPTGLGFNRVQISALDYFAKRAAASKVKTDSLSSRITVYNELDYTSTTVTADNVWLDEKILYKGADISVSEGVARATSYVKMVSIHGIGGVSPSNPNLIGVAWRAPITNWIDPKFDSDFYPSFVMGPNSMTDYVPSFLFKQLGSNPLCPFIFDYKTGILTFLDSATLLPFNLKEKVIDPTTGIVTSKYAIWVSGYTYTGRKLDNLKGGTTDQALVKNSDADYDVSWKSLSKGLIQWAETTNIVTIFNSGFQNDSVIVTTTITLDYVLPVWATANITFSNNGTTPYRVSAYWKIAGSAYGDTFVTIPPRLSLSAPSLTTVPIQILTDALPAGTYDVILYGVTYTDNSDITATAYSVQVAGLGGGGGGGGGGGLINGSNWGDYLFWNSNTSKWAVGDTNITLGAGAGQTNQGLDSVAIGKYAGNIGGSPNLQTYFISFTTPGSYSFDVEGYIASVGGIPNNNTVTVIVVGGGGGGISSHFITGGANGGSGGYTNATYINLSTITGSVGAGGQTRTNTSTQAGGDTTFSSGSHTLTATGGREATMTTIFTTTYYPGSGGTPNGTSGGGSGYGSPRTHYGRGGQSYGGLSGGWTNGEDGAVLITIEFYKTTLPGTSTIAIGSSAGKNYQGNESVAIGHNAGQTNQYSNSVAIGYNAGQTGQRANSVSIGYNAGQTGQRANAVAIGHNAGQTDQAENSIAIGQGAENTALENNADQGGGIAIGGNSKSYYTSVAIGQNATATTNGGGGSIALGANAYATYPQSIVLNGSGAAVTSSAAGFFVGPVRNLTAPNGPSIPLTYGSNIANEIAQSNWICVNKIDSTGGGLRLSSENGGLLSLRSYNGGAFEEPFLALYNLGSPAYGSSHVPDLFQVAHTGSVLNKTGVYGQMASDATLKENIVLAREYLDDVCKLQVKKYNFIDDPDKTPLLGFIAQDVEPIFPGMVPKNKTTGKYQLKTSILTPMLVSCVQTLNNKVTSLETELADIKKTLASMKT